MESCTTVAKRETVVEMESISEEERKTLLLNNGKWNDTMMKTKSVDISHWFWVPEEIIDVIKEAHGTTHRAMTKTKEDIIGKKIAIHQLQLKICNFIKSCCCLSTT